MREPASRDTAWLLMDTREESRTNYANSAIFVLGKRSYSTSRDPGGNWRLKPTFISSYGQSYVTGVILQNVVRVYKLLLY